MSFYNLSISHKYNLKINNKLSENKIMMPIYLLQSKYVWKKLTHFIFFIHKIKLNQKFNHNL